MDWQLGTLLSVSAVLLLLWPHVQCSTAERDNDNLSANCSGFTLANASKWYNELGSMMIIDSIDSSTGVFTGQYYSAVGEAEKFYILVGRYDTGSTAPTLGWTVSYHNQYKNAHSTCTWSGQYQCDSGTPTLLTTWLLTSQTEPSDNWKSTNVGFDVFTPNPQKR